MRKKIYDIIKAQAAGGRKVILSVDIRRFQEPKDMLLE